MPPITGRDQHRVDIGTREDFIHVASLQAVLIVILPVRHHAHDFAPRFLDIGDHDKLHVGLAEEVFQHLTPAGADANAANHDAVTRRHLAIPPQRRGGDKRRHAQSHCGRFQKMTSCEFHRRSETIGRGERGGIQQK